jgi:hypothetical protein
MYVITGTSAVSMRKEFHYLTGAIVGKKNMEYKIQADLQTARYSHPVIFIS